MKTNLKTAQKVKAELEKTFEGTIPDLATIYNVLIAYDKTFGLQDRIIEELDNKIEELESEIEELTNPEPIPAPYER